MHATHRAQRLESIHARHRNQIGKRCQSVHHRDQEALLTKVLSKYPKTRDSDAMLYAAMLHETGKDPRNLSAKLREGWEPVKASDHPEIFVAGVENERFKDNILIGGLLLCKAPKELVEDRNSFFNDEAASQIRSVDNNLMRENDPRMPLFNERKTKVTFGKGT